MTEEEIRARAQKVFDTISPRCGGEELQRVKDAFEFAFKAHDGQMRKGGDPYIVHPIAVAQIVAAELEMDPNVVCAAFLHDVVEDTEYTIEDIQERFGEDVAFLVNVVTKRKNTGPMMSKQVENYRQILDSVHYNIRALMVKLADRLHNMRTLDSMKPEKQMKIAGETDFFYAPLANRLGLFRVRSELENLSFRFRCPRDYEILQQQLQYEKEATRASVEAFSRQIEKILKDKGLSVWIDIRYRKPYSIWRDMRNDNVDFSNIEFKHYIRLIYTPVEGWSEKDISLFIYSVLTDHFKERPGSVANYIDTPKENGYQSFHFKLLGPDGRWEELHVSSERMLRNSRLGCIDKSNEETMNQWLDKIRNLLKDVADQGMDDFMEGVSSTFYAEDVYALTPKGRVIILPRGASAIDFAYELHTDIGDRAQYARINGKLSSIKTELHRGDCVEIGTCEDMVAKPDWLDYTRSFKAIKRLRSLFKDRMSPKYLRCECCHPLPGDDVIGFKESDDKVTLHRRNCENIIKLASEQGDRIVPVTFPVEEGVTYPVSVSVVAIDRFHLMHQIIDCITEQQHLSMVNINTTTQDQIVRCTITFGVHSADELSTVVKLISAIPGVDDVQREVL